MAPSLTISLMLTVAALCLLLPTPPFTYAAEFATDVCRNTTDFTFCRDAVYSDPRAPGADRFELIDIIFGKAYRNASDTRDYIADEIKSGRGAIVLSTCLGDYTEAIQILELVLDDLNSESYYDLDSRSLDVQNKVSSCENGVRGQPPLSQRNQNMLKFSNMCFVVSKLF